MKSIKNIIFGIITTLLISGCSADQYHLQKNHNHKFIYNVDNKKNIGSNNLIYIKDKYYLTLIRKIIEVADLGGEFSTLLKPCIALTFDDGPSKYTQELVDLLNQYGVQCTFFVVGNNCEKYSDILPIISKSGHEIAIHGDTHTSFIELGVEETEQEIMGTIDFIESHDAIVSSLVRPPYGSLNSNLEENLEYPFILWNIDTEDWKTKNEDLIKEEIVTNIQAGSIILMHDTNVVHEVDMMVLSEILPELVKKYHFVTVSELAEQYGIVLEPGKKYYKFK